MNNGFGRATTAALPSRRLTLQRRVLRTLILIVMSLGVLGMVFQVANRLLPAGYPLDVTLTRLTNIDIEGSIPNWFSTSLMLASAGLLALIAYVMQRSGNRYARHWGGLSAIFVYLSIDENVSIHNVMDGRFRDAFHLTGIFHYVWVFPAAIVLLIFLAIYRPFLLDLPSNLRRWLIVAGGVFVAGAMGMEMVGGLYASANGVETLTYYMIVTVEEMLEALGLVIFIYGLLSFIHTYLSVDVHLRD